MQCRCSYMRPRTCDSLVVPPPILGLEYLDWFWWHLHVTSSPGSLCFRLMKLEFILGCMVNWYFESNFQNSCVAHLPTFMSKSVLTSLTTLTQAWENSGLNLQLVCLYYWNKCMITMFKCVMRMQQLCSNICRKRKHVLSFFLVLVFHLNPQAMQSRKRKKYGLSKTLFTPMFKDCYFCRAGRTFM